MGPFPHQGLGNALQGVLMADDIVPGAGASYETCKTIRLFHPFGEKIVDKPLSLAQSKPREITVAGAPGDGSELVEAFNKQWELDGCDRHIRDVAGLARTYGIATMGVGALPDEDTEAELDYAELAKMPLSILSWDPLNTAGSLVLNQQAGSLDFQRVKSVRIDGKTYDRSRFVTIQHENPIYIQYEAAGFGFVGRSVYQRALYPLKSYINTMVTNNMVSLKAGVLIAKTKSQSSAVDRPMLKLFQQKREMVKEAQVGNVLSIDVDESIETMNLNNIDGALTVARKNIIEDIAAGAGMPAKLLLEESFAIGFGEGSEDAKAIAQYIGDVRAWLRPLYAFLDLITMYRAWNENFYATIQTKYPDEFGQLPYAVAFQEWMNGFLATWPNLLEEPDSEKSKNEKVTLEAVTSIFEMLSEAGLPPTEKAKLIEWLCNNINEKRLLFTDTLDLDYDAIAEYEPPAEDTDDETGDELSQVQPRHLQAI